MRKRSWAIAIGSLSLGTVLLLVASVITGAADRAASAPGEAAASADATLTPQAFLPTVSRGFPPIYASRNLSGHEVFAECNPGGTSQCPCSADDVQIASLADYGEVTSNVEAEHTYVNAIGFKKFRETFPDGTPIALGTYRYAGQFRLPTLPEADPNQVANPQAVHLMIQLWDGRNALYASDKTTLEGTIYWQLNPWESDRGTIKVYVWPLELVDTGIVLAADTAWHTFELVVDLAAGRYLSITIDGQRADLSAFELAQVHHPEWADDVSLSITTESLAAWPGPACERVFTWTTQFRDLVFSAVAVSDGQAQ
jgi:hypothetical protein